MITEASVQRAYSRLFRKEATEAGLRGEEAWSAIYGEVSLMPTTVVVDETMTLAMAYTVIRPGGTIIVSPGIYERLVR